MKVRKFADKKKELFAIIIIGFIVILVSAYVVFLVNGLTAKVYKAFGRSKGGSDSFVHFDFKTFEELGLRGSASTMAASSTPASTTPATSTKP